MIKTIKGSCFILKLLFKYFSYHILVLFLIMKIKKYNKKLFLFNINFYYSFNICNFLLLFKTLFKKLNNVEKDADSKKYYTYL